MKEEKSKLVNFRVTPRYYSYLERLARRKDMGITAYLNDMIRTETEKCAKDMVAFDAINKVAKEFDVPAPTAYVLFGPNDLDVMDEVTWEKFKARWGEVYTEALKNITIKILC
jgi:hypothetical protein